jgi:hypothetical protein
MGTHVSPYVWQYPSCTQARLWWILRRGLCGTGDSHGKDMFKALKSRVPQPMLVPKLLSTGSSHAPETEPALDQPTMPRTMLPNGCIFTCAVGSRLRHVEGMSVYEHALGESAGPECDVDMFVPSWQEGCEVLESISIYNREWNLGVRTPAPGSPPFTHTSPLAPKLAKPALSSLAEAAGAIHYEAVRL